MKAWNRCQRGIEREELSNQLINRFHLGDSNNPSEIGGTGLKIWLGVVRWPKIYVSGDTGCGVWMEPLKAEMPLKER